MPDATNDDDSVRNAWLDGAIDPHGEAALLLVESFIHGLIERAALLNEEAIAIVQVAADASFELHKERGGELATAPAAQRLLAAIARTLAIDADKRA
jgi:hypothetical protein